MLFPRGFRGFAVVMMAALMLTLVRAESSHQVTVAIPEICRYRVDSTQLRQVAADEYIQKVSIAVLSNSDRSWNLIAEPQANPGTVEWSTDGERWVQWNGLSNVILRGTKSTWNQYNIFLKFQMKRSGVPGGALVVKYQVLLED